MWSDLSQEWDVCVVCVYVEGGVSGCFRVWCNLSQEWDVCVDWWVFAGAKDKIICCCVFTNSAAD